MRSTVLALCSLLLGTVTLPSNADGDVRWQTVAYSDEDEWSSERDSMTALTSEKGATVIAINGQMRSKKTGHVDLVRWTVTLDDCRGDSGKLVTSDMSGKYVVPFDYVRGGSTFESITAQNICNLYFNANK